MTYPDQRTDHPEAVRSDPVPVPPADTDTDARPEYERDDDTTYDATTERSGGATDSGLEDRGTFGDPHVVGEDGRAGVEDDVTEQEMAGEPARRDDVDREIDDHGTVDEDVAPTRDTVLDDGDRTGDEVTDRVEDDRDGDGVDDRFDTEPTGPEPVRDTVTDADRDADGDAVADRDQDVEDAALDDRGTFDDPVVATPLDVDEDRADGRTVDGESPMFGAPAMAPTALGAATVGGTAAAAAMAGTDVRDTRDARDDDTVAPGDGAVAVDAPARAAAVDEAEMRPGDVPSQPVVALVSTDLAQGFRDRWREVQLRFVDDPRTAALEAQRLVEEAIDAVVSALQAHKSDLGGWEATEAADTEQLRVVVRRYRDFLDRVLAS
jgi:hypothetical protein